MILRDRETIMRRNSTFMNMVYIYAGILLTLLMCVQGYADTAKKVRMKVGFFEFRVVNKPVIEDAGIIIPELLSSRFMGKEDFVVYEKILKRSSSKSDAPGILGETGSEYDMEKAGSIGLDLVVTGSVISISTQMIVNARIVNLHSGQVLKTAEIRVTSLDDAGGKMGVMADSLAEIDPEQVALIRDEKQVSATRWGVWLGLNLGINTWKDDNDPGYDAEKDSSNKFVPGIPIGFFYNGDEVNLELWGRTSLSGEQDSDTVTLMGGKNLSRYMGINLMYRWLHISDQESGGEAVFNSLSAGVRIRYYSHLVINLNAGYLISGTATYPWDATDRSGSLKEMSLENKSGIFPQFWYTSIDYLLDDRWGIRWYMTIDNANSSYNSTYSDTSDKRAFGAYNTGVAVTYNMKIEK